MDALAAVLVGSLHLGRLSAKSLAAALDQPSRIVDVEMFEDETQVAWQAMPHHAPVVASDGSHIGTAEKLLGDVDEDIFHGVVLRRDDGEAVEIPAMRVKRMTAAHVVTDLEANEAENLPPYKGR